MAEYHPQAPGLLDAMAEADGPPLTELSPEEARALHAAVIEMVGPGPCRALAVASGARLVNVAVRIAGPGGHPRGAAARIVVIAQHDPLRDEGLAYAEALEAAGVPVTGVRCDDQIHVFFTLVNIMDSADAAVAHAGAAIREAVASAAAG